MANPLSITASVLTLLSACTTCVRDVHLVISSLKHAPDEVISVANGLTDLTAVLDAVKLACDDGKLAGEDVFHSTLSKARSKLDRLRSIVEGSTRSAPNEQALVDRLAWIRQKPLLRRIT